MTTKYAIVPAKGCYGSGEAVRAISVTADKAKALRLAAKYTADYRRDMARYGGSSGGYRVVETNAASKREAVWGYGHDLDREPSVA